MHYWLQKLEDYNLTKQKYFEYIQLYKNKIKNYWFQKIKDYNLTKQKYFD